MGGDFILRLANETLSNFNPLRPCGRRPESALKGSERAYFNPLRPCGRRLLGFKSQQLPAPFQSTPPVWAETFKDPLGVFKVAISIHSARVGGDLTCTLGWLASRYFNPLRPCGRRPIAFQVFLMIFGFQSTPPVWAETRTVLPYLVPGVISIHSARVGGDRKPIIIKPNGIRISIHSARVGGDCRSSFLKNYETISIHSARVGGDRSHPSGLKTPRLFQSTPPVWAETNLRIALLDSQIFQSTPPVWAETAKETIFSSLKHLYYNIFYRKKQENSM